MPELSSRALIAALIAVASAHAYAQSAGQPALQQPPGGGRRGAVQRPQRDVQQPAPAGTGTISGRVVSADTGRPVKRARVIVVIVVSGIGEPPGDGGRGGGLGRPYTSTTDEQGRYAITGLPQGTYNIRTTKTGFVDAAFGQRRALRSGTPIELTEGQRLASIDLKLSRGGVVTGRVLDEDGEPLARAVVTVLRQQYVRGEKQLTPAGADQSDDRGQFRVFGLPPGHYYVSASAGGVERVIRQLPDPGAGPDQAPESTGYAATYYPGVTSAVEATRIALAAAQELTGIDFQIQIVPLATVKGLLVGGSGTVMLVPDESAGLGGGRGVGGGRGGGTREALSGGQGLRTATRPDGTFSITNVAPGSYTIIARMNDLDLAGSNARPRTAVQSLTVAGEDVTVALTLTPGVQVSGTITLESSAVVPRGFAGFRINPLPLGSAAAMLRMARPADVSETGQFTIADVMSGRYSVRATGPRGWMMKSVFLDGRDVTEQPIEIKGENVSGLNVVFTDRLAGVSGAVRDSRGSAAAAGLTVIAFSSDEALWTPQSRHILTARTNASGAYTIGAMPEGDYLLAVVDDVEQGEWFDPVYLEQLKATATKVKVGEGETKTQDLKVPAS